MQFLPGGKIMVVQKFRNLLWGHLLGHLREPPNLTKKNRHFVFSEWKQYESKFDKNRQQFEPTLAPEIRRFAKWEMNQPIMADVERCSRQ